MQEKKRNKWKKVIEVETNNSEKSNVWEGETKKEKKCCRKGKKQCDDKGKLGRRQEKDGK